MAYIGQPVPSTVIHLSQIKISDGKSVDVTVEKGKGVEAGNFYVLDGFLGVVLQTVKAEANTAGMTVALQIEQCEYITAQIDTSKDFKKGSLVYFDSKANQFTNAASAGAILAGRVSSAKDASNTIQFIRYPQTDTTAATV